MKFLHTISYSNLARDYYTTAILFKQFWQKILIIAFIPNALTFILGIAFKLALGNAFANSSSLAALFTFTNINFIVILLLAITIILIQAMGIVAMIHVVTHAEHTTIAKTIEETLTYLGRFVVLSIIVFAFSMVGLILGYIPVFVIGTIIAFFSLPLFDGTFDWLTFIASGFSVLTALFFVFAPYILIKEKTRVNEALKRSFALVKKSFFSVLVRIGILTTLSTVLTLTLLYIPRIGSTLSAMIITPFSVLFIATLLRNIEGKQETVAPATPTASTTTPAQSAS